MMPRRKSDSVSVTSCNAQSMSQNGIARCRIKGHVANADGGKSPTCSSSSLLTPHTVRLLKLIEVGSNDHAKLAVTHLKLITMECCPIVLWEILGRLQAFLVSPEWITRSNAGLAMEGVAKHLPVQDQEDFLSQDHDGMITSMFSDEECATSLNITDLEGNINTVLKKGRLLVSSVESRFEEEDDGEDQVLENIDENYKGTEKFCALRLEMQRSILAKRLGLSDVLAHCTVDFDQTIKTQMIDEYPPKKRRKQEHQASKKTRKRISIRTLLTTEIIQQQQQQQQQNEQQNNKETEYRSNAVSHRNSQVLLAGELMFRIFDPSWYVRHGSLIGILSLIRAWKAHRRNHEGRLQFGVWPHDILARTICVLALDRFGDYSGASIEEESSSCGMVAPVREMAGQVFAVVFLMSPEPLRLKANGLLSELLQHHDWETRHGVLIALKYIVVLIGKEKYLEEYSQWKKEFLMVFIDSVIAALEDKNDDVQAVASQILCFSLPYFDNEKEQKYYIPRIIQSLWKPLSNTREVSSSINDMVKLLAQLIRTRSTISFNAVPNTDSSLDALAQLFSKMSELIRRESILSKVSVLRVITALSDRYTHIINIQNKTNISEKDNIQLQKCFAKTVKIVYSGLFQISLVRNNDSLDNERHCIAEVNNLYQVYEKTWETLSTVSNAVFHDNSMMQNELEYDLLTNFFDNTSAKNLSGGLLIGVLKDHANTVAIFINHAKKQQEVPNGSDTFSARYDILKLFLLSYVDSPFSFHCKAVCCLIQALCNLNVHHLLISNDKSDLWETLHHCQTRLIDKLYSGELCNFYAKSNQLVKDPNFFQCIRDSLSIGYDIVLQKKGSSKAAATVVIDYWRKAGFFLTSIADPDTKQLTVDLMRVNSEIVGTFIAGRIQSLPIKLTPIVRPLMTSIQNEQDIKLQCLLSVYMKIFLLSIRSVSVSSDRKEGFQKTFTKVLNNICKLLLAEREPGFHTASLVISSLVNESTTLKLLTPLWERLHPLRESINNENTVEEKSNALLILKTTCRNLKRNHEITKQIFDDFIFALIGIGCSEHGFLRNISSHIIKNMCSVDSFLFLEKGLPILIVALQDNENDIRRSGACLLLRDILDSIEDISIVCPFVRTLMPIAMSMMIDPVKVCAETSASIFSYLVQVAPLVKESVTIDGSKTNQEASLVIDHLIHGKKLTTCKIDPKIFAALSDRGIVLRNYQLEGVSWLRFLQRMNLNGALCDQMGLGKTLQALLGVCLAHKDYCYSTEARSLVVCPSTVVGHWSHEIERCFPENSSVFRAFSFVGNAQERKKLWKTKLSSSNLIITSYEVLRSDVHLLSGINWIYCILDEGHLLRNPKTMTSRASRQLRARHKLILTGTPIQNSVNEVWATFDFLMPNFLGSSSEFKKEFAKPIIKGQNFDAAAADIATGMEKLKVLHQQVLPFILRREKEQVLQELPPKIIQRIPCSMSNIQEDLYERFCSNQQGKQLLSKMNKMINTPNTADENQNSALSASVLRSLLYLRLLCTHPCLVMGKEKKSTNQYVKDMTYSIEDSGKLVALRELLRGSGMDFQEMTAADNDSSLLYCDKDEIDIDEYDRVLDPSYEVSLDTHKHRMIDKSKSKCLIFGQFTSSLDIVEEFLLKRFMPSVKYLRLDGRVPISKRSAIVDKFNIDESIRLLLLTTKIGGLGLNLNRAETVIILEPDWNPHTDIQAMDRAHRLGQKRTVNVYQLVTTNSIEEKTMLLHERKLAMSKAIVNTDNSSMYSMGTDRLLDIFQFRSERSTNVLPNSDLDTTLNSLVERYQDEYQSLSLDDFLSGFQCETAS